MEHNENSDQVLNRYFAKAGEEQPVVAIDEVKEIITTTPVSAVDYRMAEQVLSKFKYWLGGGLIVTAGIVVWMSTAPGKQKAEVKNIEPAIETVVETGAPVTAINSNDQSQTIKEVAPVAKIEEATKGSSDNTVTESTEASKRKTYYYPGAAQVNFEMDGKMINMSIDTDVRSLQVDGVTINKSDYGSYTEIIDKGKAMKFESDKHAAADAEPENAEELKNKTVMTALVSQMEEDKLIDDSGHFEFRLTAFKLYINSEEQPEVIFQQYKELYESASGNKLNKKSNIRIKH